mgnify:CR=1 FL=1
MILPTSIITNYFSFDFECFTLNYPLEIIIDDETIILEAGQSIKIEKNIRVQYSNPFKEECEYIAICLPAFSIDKVNREEN